MFHCKHRIESVRLVMGMFLNAQSAPSVLHEAPYAAVHSGSAKAKKEVERVIESPVIAKENGKGERMDAACHKNQSVQGISRWHDDILPGDARTAITCTRTLQAARTAAHTTTSRSPFQSISCKFRLEMSSIKVRRSF